MTRRSILSGTSRRFFSNRLISDSTNEWLLYLLDSSLMSHHVSDNLRAHPSVAQNGCPRPAFAPIDADVCNPQHQRDRQERH